MNSTEKNYIFGIHAIIEAIQAGKTIDKLFIQKGLHNDSFAELWKLVRLRRINYKHVPIEKINRLTRKNHQGVFAFISPIEFHKIEDLIPQIFERGESPLIIVLDRVTVLGILERLLELQNVQVHILFWFQNKIVLQLMPMQLKHHLEHYIKSQYVGHGI